MKNKEIILRALCYNPDPDKQERCEQSINLENGLRLVEKMWLKVYKILQMRFGLEDGITHTLGETGKEFRVTRERIRQMEAKGLELIRQYKD